MIAIVDSVLQTRHLERLALDGALHSATADALDAHAGLADRALAQSLDRYTNGVTNYLEVVRAREAVQAASDNYIESLFSFNQAMLSFARAMGNAETNLNQFLKAN